MANFWKIEGIPHKGWNLEDVIDIREDGQSVEETNYETCMMCNNERIRYVHIVSHPEVGEDYRVGCICAEKMTNDYINPKQRENQLRNKANRRRNWLNKNWKTNHKGNLYLKIQNHFILIYQDKNTYQYKIKIGDIWGKKKFNDLESAKIAVFNGIEYLKEHNQW